MAEESVNITEDTEMAECDGDKVVTMMDVLQEQQAFEEDANAVLGASDDKNCTYSKGYIKRQALYACLTCCPDVKTDPTKRAGICLACSLNCHESHELIELYTKRNFRCDCGNPNFNSHPCQFTSSKDDLNNDNIYSQNFSGLYCTCNRPYPDPDPNDDDEDMIQCIICEDWLHASHLDAEVPANDQYSEMICKGCMEKNEFLHDYSNITVNVESVDIMTVNGNHNGDHSACNGDVTTAASVLNGGNVERAEDKEKMTENLEVKDKTDDLDNKEDVDTNSTKQETMCAEEKEIIDNIKENDTAPQSEQNNDTATDDKEKNGEDDKTETNKTEDQLLDDMSVLTSDKPSEELKSSIDEAPAKDGETNDNVENSTAEGADTTEKRALEETSECNNKNVPDSLHETSVKDNVDDKTDDVMDAIDAFLESTTDGEPSENLKDKPEQKETNGEPSEKLKQEEETQVPDGTKKDDTTSDKSQKADTDVEMADKSQNENSTTKEKETQETDLNKSDITETNNAAVLEDEEKSKEDTPADEEIVTNKRKLSITEESSPKKVKLDKCVRPKGVKKVYNGATFWPSNFRQKLCTCGECTTMYKDLNVLFLTDLEDTVAFYESLGKNNIEGLASQYEKGLQALSSLDRIQQINALTEYNKMRDKLVDYLKSFQDRKEIVKEEDIRAFFAGIKARREPDGVYFCR